jgi:glycosyltransferase involved in cell wall biosynthesis
MNILFITPSVPSRLHRIRAWQLIEVLAKKHAVHLLTLSVGEAHTDEFEELKNKCASVTIVQKKKYAAWISAGLGIFRLEPLEVSYCRSRAMREAATRICTSKNIDLVYVKRLRSVQFVSDLEAPIVLDSTDAMSMFYKRALKSVSIIKKLFYWYEYVTYRLYEHNLGRTYKRWVVCSPIDAAYLSSVLPRDAGVSVLPNMVNTDHYSFSRTKQDALVVSSGLFTKFVNIEAANYFVREVWPTVISLRPETHLLLVGPAGRDVRALARPNIDVVGEVRDIREYVRRATVIAVPVLTGSGTRNKILQAWSMGRPVVTTYQGAEGLEGKDDVHYLLARDAKDFAQKILMILGDPSKAEALANAGRLLVEQKYSPSAIEEQLSDIFRL